MRVCSAHDSVAPFRRTHAHVYTCFYTSVNTTNNTFREKGPKVVAVWTTVCTRNIRPRRRARANRWERGRDVSATTTVYGTPYRRHCRRQTLEKAHANRYRNAIGFYTPTTIITRCVDGFYTGRVLTFRRSEPSTFSKTIVFFFFSKTVALL